MIRPLGSNNWSGADAEYMRMMREMHYFGLSPSGDKNADAQKLYQVKAEVVQRIVNNSNTSDSQSSLGVQVINPVDESGYAQKSELEEQRLGAVNIALLNKIYFGL